MASKSVSKPKLIYVEGNIGSGKSTLMDLCRSRENLEVIGEPVEKWHRFYTHNFLKYKYCRGRMFRLSPSSGSD